jgi:hypothetical protein
MTFGIGARFGALLAGSGAVTGCRSSRELIQPTISAQLRELSL